MGTGSSKAIEGGLSPHREFEQRQPSQIEATDSAMGDRSNFNEFLEANNCMVKMAQEKYDQYDELKRQNRDLKKRNEEIMTQYENLRQRVSNDSEMNHRSHQSSSEDVTSKNKRSDVLQKCKKLDGAIRRQAMEVFGRQSDRAEIWYRKDLTCRIFMVAYELAERTKEEFIQDALPRFFQIAPFVGVHFKETPMQAKRISEQQISEEMQQLLSTDSFKIASSSVLKELAVNCDLTDLEESIPPAKTIQSTLLKKDTVGADTDKLLIRAWDPFGGCVTVFIKESALLRAEYRDELENGGSKTLCVRFWRGVVFSTKKLMTELTSFRDHWQDQYPWLPYLEDNKMKSDRMKGFIKECLRIAWRMVNLLPPLKIVTIDKVESKSKLDEYFEKEVEENKEKTQTMNVCVWPAVMDCYNNEVLLKGKLTLIPSPKPSQMCHV